MTNEKGEPTINLAFYKAKWRTQAYYENNGVGPAMVKNFHFIERLHYGFVDNENNSIIPREEFIVETQHGRVFDFVADSYSLMRLNWGTALQKNLVSSENSAFGSLKMIGSYKNPKSKYGEYLGEILRFYNNEHIPNIIGTSNITSYEDYVNSFFVFLFKEFDDFPVTMTRWNTSIFSDIKNTGLAFSYADVDFDADQQKITQIIDHPSFNYFKNLCLNMGFSMDHNYPNTLVYDIKSPANSGLRSSYGFHTLSGLFEERFVQTHTIDNDLLYRIINIYYNKYVQKRPQIKITKVVWNGICNVTKIKSKYIRLSTVNNSHRPYTDVEELNLYCKIRNLEEGSPFSDQKVDSVFKKAKYFLKKVDKAKAMSYINSKYRDQVWNKDHGFHDLKRKLRGNTTTETQREQVGPTIPIGSGTGGGSSY
jgi:hypothetical protein